MKRPNILFLLTDDQRFDMLGCFPGSKVKTPCLDALAASGVHFANAHIPGGTNGAVCMPSRAMLNTGRELHGLVDEGLEIPPEHTTLPELLRRNGYETYGIGKWHNGRASHHRSFSNGGAIFFGGMWDHWNVPVYNHDPEGRYDHTIPYCPDFLFSRKVVQRGADYIANGIHSSELFVDKAIELLKQHDPSKNFYMNVAFLAPHDPRTMPEKFRAMYSPDDMELPPNFLPEPPIPLGVQDIRDERLAAAPRQPGEIRQHICDYHGIVSHLDAEIGRLLDALKETGMYDDTLVILAGDNGLAVGEHGLMGKQNVFEHSVRVPLIIAGPGVRQGAASNAPVMLNNIYPTLCGLLGIETPGSVTTRGFGMELDGSGEFQRDFFYLECCEFHRGFKHRDMKLIEAVVDGRHTGTLFYDLAADPYETTNLANHPAHAATVAEFRALMLAEAKRNGDFESPKGRIFWKGCLEAVNISTP